MDMRGRPAKEKIILPQNLQREMIKFFLKTSIPKIAANNAGIVDNFDNVDTGYSANSGDNADNFNSIKNIDNASNTDKNLQEQQQPPNSNEWERLQ